MPQIIGWRLQRNISPRIRKGDSKNYKSCSEGEGYLFRNFGLLSEHFYSKINWFVKSFRVSTDAKIYFCYQRSHYIFLILFFGCRRFSPFGRRNTTIPTTTRNIHSYNQNIPYSKHSMIWFQPTKRLQLQLSTNLRNWNEPCFSPCKK